MRYAVSVIAGDGQPPDGYYAAAQDITIPVLGIKAFRVAKVIGLDGSGQLVAPWCLCALDVVPGSTWALAEGASNVDLFPEHPLDSVFNSIPVATRNALLAAMQARGIDVGFIGPSDSMRDVILHLGQIHEANFDVDTFLP